MTAPDRLLTIPDLCDMLSVSESTIRRLVNSGSVPFLKVGGGIRFRLADVDEYLDKQTIRAVNA